MAAEKTVPARNALAITPSDTEEIKECRSIYVGTTGDLAYIPRLGAALVTLVNVPEGSLLPIDARIIHTDSTASDIVVLY